MLFVPVVDCEQRPLMPTTPARARRWVRYRKAVPFWKRGVFCIRLTFAGCGRKMQPISVGIDPGVKMEGLTVKSQAHTYLNIQATAVTWVTKHLDQRRIARRNRRYRNSPCRASRHNRKGTSLPPSVRARWAWKLRLCLWLLKLYPISGFVVEDVKAVTKTGVRRWNKSFSPIQLGKNWFYRELGALAPVSLCTGFDTYNLRKAANLAKGTNKTAIRFNSHCVDSWVLANSGVGGHTVPENTDLLHIIPLQFHRRQLQVFYPAKGGLRKAYGGTKSGPLKRGSLVKHVKYGLTYVGGQSKCGISLHSLSGGLDGGRVCRSAKPGDIKFLSYSSWIVRNG